jgi:8-oxo-dGTP diphosphatase
MDTKASDWDTKPFPEKSVSIVLDRKFDESEMKSIRNGLKPQEMEDKWFIYCENDILYFHRSWTGFCLYRVYFEKADDHYKMFKADLNRDKVQYTEESNEYDALLISFLIDALLLHRNAEFPLKNPADDMSPVDIWSSIGRAMFDTHSETNKIEEESDE